MKFARREEAKLFLAPLRHHVRPILYEHSGFDTTDPIRPRQSRFIRQRFDFHFYWNQLHTCRKCRTRGAEGCLKSLLNNAFELLRENSHRQLSDRTQPRPKNHVKPHPNLATRSDMTWLNFGGMLAARDTRDVDYY